MAYLGSAWHIADIQQLEANFIINYTVVCIDLFLNCPKLSESKTFSFQFNKDSLSIAAAW